MATLARSVEHPFLILTDHSNLEYVKSGALVAQECLHYKTYAPSIMRKPVNMKYEILISLYPQITTFSNQVKQLHQESGGFQGLLQ